MKKTNEQIGAEVAKLEILKPQVRRYNVFGEDHYHAIDAQIAVLSDEYMYIDEIYDTYGDEEADEFEQNVLDAAIEACDWRDGSLAEDEAPNVGWSELVEEKP
jgi:hypothetical protein